MAKIDDIDSLTLRGLLNRLPQELYDDIYDRTFTAEKKIHFLTFRTGEYEEMLGKIIQEHHFIALNAKLPHLFHVDKASWKQFASSYFASSGSVFVFYPAKHASTKDLPFAEGFLHWMAKLLLVAYPRPYESLSTIKLRPEDEKIVGPMKGRILIGLHDAHVVALVDIFACDAEAGQKSEVETKVEKEGGNGEGGD